MPGGRLAMVRSRRATVVWGVLGTGALALAVGAALPAGATTTSATTTGAATTGAATTGAATTGATTTSATTTSARAGETGAAGAVAVTVNATAGLGQIPANAIGLNTAVYDGNMNGSAVPGLLKAAGFTALRYPGGSYADIYNWQTNVAKGGYDAPNTSFGDFMGTAQAAGTDPIIAVNYGTGTPDLAAGWVQHANVTNHYGITYWEVGNEVYGNGTYGANWEADSHCTDASGGAIAAGTSPSQTYNCGPGVYAAGVAKFTSAMKAVSPNIHVCTVLTTPGYWPDNVTNATTSPKPWNETVLSSLGSKTDCVIVHYYPAYGFSDVAKMMATTSDISGIVSTVRSQIRQYAGVDPATVPILVTETNSTIATNTQPGALFTADSYLGWLESGVTNVDYWDQHNGPGTPSIVAGAQDYGDYGIFSSGANGSGVTEPPLDTPFPPYYAIQLISKLGRAGDTMVTAASGNPLVKAHAVRRTDGSLGVMLVNEDPTNSYPVNLTYRGFTASGDTTVHTFVNKATSVASATQSSAASVTLAPYSITVLAVPGSGKSVATAPGAPGQPTVSGLSSTTSSDTSGTATLSWTASTKGTYPVANYQVYQLDSASGSGAGGSGAGESSAGGNGGGTLLASPTGTTLSLTGLRIGASYRYQVIAVDTEGNPSQPSAPLVVTVPPPADASCAVHYSVANSWSGGFTASITVTNRATTAVDGWKLTFTWPAQGEAVQSGWNATWTQSGQNVTVTNDGSNATIAAGGGTVTVGFNGVETGQSPAPAAFYLNGRVCSNI